MRERDKRIYFFTVHCKISEAVLRDILPALIKTMSFSYLQRVFFSNG